MVGILVPSDRRLVEIDEHLFCLKIFLEAPGTQLAAEAGLLVAAPRRFDVGRLHVIDPYDAGAERLHDAEGFVNVARPNRGREAVGSVVRDANRLRFAFERNHRGHGTENFFPSDARAVVDGVEDCRLAVISFDESPRPSAADGHLRFFFPNLKVGADTVVLLLAHQRPHLRFALHRCAELDALGLFRHGFDKFWIDSLFNQDAAARGANLALIDEHTKERAIDGGFPIGSFKENVWRLAAEFERDAFERIRGTLDDNLAYRGTAGEGDLVHPGMRDKRGSQFPSGHQKWVIPRNDLARDADRLAQREA